VAVIAATLAATVVVALLRLRAAEEPPPPAAAQASAATRVSCLPDTDSPDAGSHDAGASGRVRDDSSSAAAGPTMLPCGVQGCVRTSVGRPVPNSRIFLVARDHGWRQQATTGPDGRFEFKAAVGPHTLVAPPFARLPGVEQQVELRAGVTRVEVTVPLLATAQIDGRIVDTDGVPLAGTRAVLHTASAPAVADVVETDRGGNFHLVDVPLGELVLRTSEPIHAEVRGHELTANPTSSLPFVLDIGRHSVAGRVVTEGGPPAVGAHVRLDRSFTSGTGVRCVSTRTLVTDANGYFAFERIGPGPGALTVLASGCVTEVVAVEAGSFPVVVVHRIAN
jgi:hypothetical protein